MPEHQKTQAEIEADVALKVAQAEEALSKAAQAVAERAFFEAHAKAAEASAEEQQIQLRAKRRIESIVLAQDELNHVYVFDDAVDELSVKKCVQTLTTWSRQDVTEHGTPRPIEVQINSPGGDIFSGLALVDFIKDLRRRGHEVTAVCYGMAASMGGVILQAAEHRVMGENAFLLLHEGSLLAFGDFAHVEDEVALMKKLHERILALFAERSNLSRREIERKWKRKDWWLNADEAVKLGFVDEVRR